MDRSCRGRGGEGKEEGRSGDDEDEEDEEEENESEEEGRSSTGEGGWSTTNALATREAKMLASSQPSMQPLQHAAAAEGVEGEPKNSMALFTSSPSPPAF